MPKHGLFDIKLRATGDDQHHIVEDVAISLGKAFGEALGEKRGIVRMANVAVPMDETLVTVAIDIGGRGYAVLNLPFAGNDMSGFSPDLVQPFPRVLRHRSQDEPPCRDSLRQQRPS